MPFFKEFFSKNTEKYYTDVLVNRNYIMKTTVCKYFKGMKEDANLIAVRKKLCAGVEDLFEKDANGDYIEKERSTSNQAIVDRESQILLI